MMIYFRYMIFMNYIGHKIIIAWNRYRVYKDNKNVFDSLSLWDCKARIDITVYTRKNWAEEEKTLTDEERDKRELIKSLIKKAWRPRKK